MSSSAPRDSAQMGSRCLLVFVAVWVGLDQVAGKGRSNRSSITQIFNKTGTDKLWLHGYHRYYEDLLAPFRKLKGVSVLEIGVEDGKSMKAWVDYFERPDRIDGIAYRANMRSCEDNESPGLCKFVRIFDVDQSNVSQLQNFVAAAAEGRKHGPPGWDVIIDDGSHIPMHVLTSFKHLFPYVRPGGLYIVEDLETNYVEHKSSYGYEFSAGLGKPPPANAIEKFKQLIDVVSRHHFKYPELTVFGANVDASVAKVSFGDGMLWVKKKPDDARWNRYPLSAKLFVKRKDAAPSVEAFKEQLKKENPIP